MRVSVVICTCGRASILPDTLDTLTVQTQPAHEVIIVATQPSDIPDLTRYTAKMPLRVEFSEKGLPKQRNHALSILSDQCDIVFFIDDDYMPSADALEQLSRAFAALPYAAGMNGTLLADGIHSRGIDASDARNMLRNRPAVGPVPIAIKRNLVGLYGCNMAYRTAVIGDTRFDEALPLYGWQEDVDFASRVAGEMAQVTTVTGVHCGTKLGRESSGEMLGYSQVANPIYLSGKGQIPPMFLLKLAMKNILANHLKQLCPEDWIDRAGRARGNRAALKDWIRGKVSPDRLTHVRPSPSGPKP